MLELGVKTLIAYLLGSIVGALLIGTLRGVDIRSQGSGNAGGTNALRTQGVWFALATVVVDLGKGWVATRVVPALAWPAPDPAVTRAWLTVACAGAAVAGHVYPVWHQFRGGKGAATLIGVLAGLMPAALPPVLGVWLLVVMLSGFVGLGTIVAAFSFPLLLAFSDRFGLGVYAASPALAAFAWLMAAFILYTHRSNLKRMHEGTESRARSLWLLKSRAARS
jgi:acyl phosphate:glycerol-3-phosphate acyltransferase